MLSYSIARAIAATAQAGVGFSLLRMALILLGIAGIVATTFVTGVSLLGALIAGYWWLLLAEPHWSIGFPIILFPLISWLWFLVRLRDRGTLGEWIWIPFFFVWTLFCGPALGWGLAVITAASAPLALYRLGYSLFGSAIAFVLVSANEWTPRILWPVDPLHLFQGYGLFAFDRQPTSVYTAAFFVTILLSVAALMRMHTPSGTPERRVMPTLLALSLFDVRLLTSAAAIGVIQWACAINSLNLPRGFVRHLKLHQWLLPLFLLIDTARVITSTKYVAEGRAERCGAGLDFLNVPIYGGQWLLAHHVEQGGLVAPSVRLVKEWLLLTNQGPTPNGSRSEEVLFSDATSEEKRDDSLVPYPYVALLHRDTSQAQLLKRLVGNRSWRLVYADFLTAVYIRTDGQFSTMPEFRVGRLYDESIIGSALKSIQPIQGYREKIARWLWLREPPPGEAFYFGSFLLHAGKPREASDVLIFAALQSPNASEVTRTLGEASELLGEIEIAERAFGLYLMGNDSDTNVRNRFEAVGNAVTGRLGVSDSLPD